MYRIYRKCHHAAELIVRLWKGRLNTTERKVPLWTLADEAPNVFHENIVVALSLESYI